MRNEKLAGINVIISGGTDGHGGGTGLVVVLLHGYGAPGDDLVVLSDYLDVPAGTRFLFPEAPISIPLGYGDARGWWIIDMARIQADRAAGRIRDMSNEIPRGLIEARQKVCRICWTNFRANYTPIRNRRSSAASPRGRCSRAMYSFAAIAPTRD